MHEGVELMVSSACGEGYLPTPTSASGPAPPHVNEAVVGEHWRKEGQEHHGEGRGRLRGAVVSGMVGVFFCFTLFISFLMCLSLFW